MIDHALPFWSTRGFDEANGRFCERLDFSGNPLWDVPHRAMVQGRQIYVFAHAALLGWFPDGEKIARVAMTSLLRDFRLPGGGFAFSVDRTGRVVAGHRDTYSQAFVLFALGWMYRLTSEASLLDVADELIGHLDAHLADQVNGGYFNSDLPLDVSKRQNPHMHLLEALIALETSAPARGYLDRAAGIVNLCKLRLFSSAEGVLLEHFARDWSSHPDPTLAKIFEPGHHLEWAWLLDAFYKLSSAPLDPLITKLDSTARQRGIDEGGLIYDEVLSNFEPHKLSHRIWPHTEGAKAAAVRYLSGDLSAASFASGMVSVLFDRFLDVPFAGGWADQIDRRGEVMVDFVPASSLYHLFAASAELTRVFGGRDLPKRLAVEVS